MAQRHRPGIVNRINAVWWALTRKEFVIGTRTGTIRHCGNMVLLMHYMNVKEDMERVVKRFEKEIVPMLSGSKKGKGDDPFHDLFGGLDGLFEIGNKRKKED